MRRWGKHMSSFIVGRFLSALLALGALLHAFGSFQSFEPGSPGLVWSLGSASFALFLAVLAFYANSAPASKGLLFILMGGLAVWAAIALAFGFAIGAVADPRVVYHVLVSLALVVQLGLLSGWR